MPEKLSRSEQSRINGAKSKGPVTIAGKARSSQNALTHGFAAVINIVLTTEDEAVFAKHLAGFRSSFLPQNYVEETLVDQLASISWRQSRLAALETGLLDDQMSIQDQQICDQYPTLADDNYFHLIQAWKALSRQPTRPSKEDPAPTPDSHDINSLELLRRYQTSLDRQYRNTLLNLRQYRKDFAPGNVLPGNANLPIGSASPLPSTPETPSPQIEPERATPKPISCPPPTSTTHPTSAPQPAKTLEHPIHRKEDAA